MASVDSVSRSQGEPVRPLLDAGRAARIERPRGNLAQPDPVRQDPFKPGPLRSDPMRQDVARTEPGRGGAIDYRAESRAREPRQRFYEPDAAWRSRPAADDMRIRMAIENSRSSDEMTEAATRRAVREYGGA